MAPGGARDVVASPQRGGDAGAGTVVHWHALPAHEVVRALDSGEDGLSGREAGARAARHGPNALPVAPPEEAWRILIRQFDSIITLLLVAAVVVALATGAAGDAIAIGVILAVNTAIGFATEVRGRRAMEALARLVVTRARVVRDGQLQEVDARGLVPGDVITLDAGDSVPADARLLRSDELRTGEAAMTGESLPVDKLPNAVLAPETALAERVTMVFQGTTIAAGRGRAVVVATGRETELGRIGTAAAAIATERTPLERRLDRLGRRLAGGAVVAGVVIAAVAWWRGAGLATVLEAAIAIAVAAVPEGLPAVITIAMARGVHRMARRRALVRRLPMIEALGATTVICTDKTGTLTTGEMMLAALWTVGASWTWRPGDPPAPASWSRAATDDGAAADAALHESLAVAMRACGSAPASGRHRDPEGEAIVRAALASGVAPAAGAPSPPHATIAFTSARLLSGEVRPEADGRLHAFIRGAPIQVMERCASIRTTRGVVPFDEAARADVVAANHALATRGLRVYALATGIVQDTHAHALAGLTFVALAGLMDPPSPGAGQTIGALREAGIRLVMLTGDQRATAVAIARALGLLADDGAVLDGPTIDRMSDEALAVEARRVMVCSRVTPDGKLRLVRALQRCGDVVAMLGDGVNDAAALRQADVGVAMGKRGTDAAREAAGIVLADDRLETVAAAVEEGRLVFDNIRHFVLYLFSCNLGEILTLLGASLAGWPLPLAPLQLLWLNVVTDSLPALALAVEPGEPGLMRRAPRDPRTEVVSRRAFRWILRYAAAIAASSLAAFAWGLHGPAGDAARASTLCFMTLALAQLWHLGNARARGTVVARGRWLANPFAVVAVAVGVALQLAAAAIPGLASVLSVVPPTPADWMVILALSAIPAVAGQLLKRVATAPPPAAGTMAT